MSTTTDADADRGSDAQALTSSRNTKGLLKYRIYIGRSPLDSDLLSIHDIMAPSTVTPQMYHSAFTTTLDTLLHDRTQSNSALRERAQLHLAVLDRPQVASYTLPDLDPCLEITAKRVFIAMYQVGDEFHKPASARFVSAGICACAEVIATSSGWHHELHALTSDERLVEALNQLAMDLLTDLRCPCTPLSSC